MSLERIENRGMENYEWVWDAPQRAVLVAVIRDRQTQREAMEYLDELEFLAQTAGIQTEKIFTQRLSTLVANICRTRQADRDS